MHYFDEAQSIWREFVPRSGQADTLQGELLRAVEKLRDESQRNGNINWGDGFEILRQFLEVHLADKAVFSEATIAATKVILHRLRDYEFPLVDDEPFDELGDRVVEYYRHHGSKPHINNPQLRR